MRKIRLQLDALAVDSFEADVVPSFAGTVDAREAEASAPNPCLPETLVTCPRRQTLYNSCVANCECTNGLHACIGPIRD